MIRNVTSPKTVSLLTSAKLRMNIYEIKESNKERKESNVSVKFIAKKKKKRKRDLVPRTPTVPALRLEEYAKFLRSPTLIPEEADELAFPRKEAGIYLREWRFCKVNWHSLIKGLMSVTLELKLLSNCNNEMFTTFHSA